MACRAARAVGSDARHYRAGAGLHAATQPPRRELPAVGARDLLRRLPLAQHAARERRARGERRGSTRARHRSAESAAAARSVGREHAAPDGAAPQAPGPRRHGRERLARSQPPAAFPFGDECVGR
eukprot:3206849-Rhodomonas_salina.2